MTKMVFCQAFLSPTCNILPHSRIIIIERRNEGVSYFLNMHVKEELALVARAQAGERDALSTLWDNITPKLYGYLCHTLRQTQVAEDVLQETWLKAITALPRFRPRGVRFSAWLFAIARNECRQHWRNSKQEVIGVEENVAISVSDSDTMQEKLLVETVLQRLTKDDCDILTLHYLAGLTFNDIAGILHISPLSARVRSHRALRRARVILDR